jgi:hypothetical protein
MVRVRDVFGCAVVVVGVSRIVRVVVINVAVVIVGERRCGVVFVWFG